MAGERKRKAGAESGCWRHDELRVAGPCSEPSIAASTATGTAVTSLPVWHRARQIQQCYTLAEDGLAALARAAFSSSWPCRYRARFIFIERKSRSERIWTDRICSQSMENPPPKACRTSHLEVWFPNDSSRPPRTLCRRYFLHRLCCGRHG